MLTSMPSLKPQMLLQPNSKVPELSGWMAQSQQFATEWMVLCNTLVPSLSDCLVRSGSRSNPWPRSPSSGWSRCTPGPAELSALLPIQRDGVRSQRPADPICRRQRRPGPRGLSGIRRPYLNFIIDNNGVNGIIIQFEFNVDHLGGRNGCRSFAAVLSPQYPDMKSAFPLQKMQQNVAAWAKHYRENQPFPHIGIDDFFDESIIRNLVSDYPGEFDASWNRTFLDAGTYEEQKLGLNRLEAFPPSIQHFVNALNSRVFVEFLERLTGIDGLIPDPHLSGGGLHMIPRGGRLAVHADFNVHKKLRP